MLGSGAIIVVDDSVPIVSVALRLAEFYRHESCGKCVPCREGTNWTVKMLERIDRGEATPMDLDVMADVQGNIIGNCLCLLGDSMAMPVGSMIKHFRPEFEAHIEDGGAVGSRQSAAPIRQDWPCRPRRGCLMSQGDWITFIDRRARGARARGRVAARRGQARRRRGALLLLREEARARPWARAACAWSRSRGSRSCRPRAPRRSRTAWSCYTQTDRVKDAQNAVVEFLLVNHPLDCPVCDKGGECPLQDIAFGWGPGRSRFVEDKRNFPKPIALSPLIAIDRERCILCYRCVRFSQEVAEDDQLDVPRARRPHLRRHVRRPPLPGAVLGQRDRPVPGRGAHQHRLPLPRAAVGHRGRRHDLHAVPEPVQRRADDPRRARRARAAARQRRRRRRLAVRQGPLGLPVDAPGRPRARAAGARRRSPAPGDLGACARRRRPRGWRKAGAGDRGASSAGRPPTRRAGCCSASSARRLGSPHVDSRAGGPLAPSRRARGSLIPTSRRRCPTSTAPRPCWCSRATRWTRRRSSTCGCARRCAASARACVVASSAPTALDGGASEVLRFAPGGAEALLRALQKALLEAGAAPPNGAAEGDGGSRGAAQRPRRASPACSPSTPSSASPRPAEVDLTDLRDAAALLTAGRTTSSSSGASASAGASAAPARWRRWPTWRWCSAWTRPRARG